MIEILFQYLLQNFWCMVGTKVKEPVQTVIFLFEVSITYAFCRWMLGLLEDWRHTLVRVSRQHWVHAAVKFEVWRYTSKVASWTDATLSFVTSPVQLWGVCGDHMYIIWFLIEYYLCWSLCKGDVCSFSDGPMTRVRVPGSEVIPVVWLGYPRWHPAASIILWGWSIYRWHGIGLMRSRYGCGRQRWRGLCHASRRLPIRIMSEQGEALIKKGANYNDLWLPAPTSIDDSPMLSMLRVKP